MSLDLPRRMYVLYAISAPAQSLIRRQLAERESVRRIDSAFDQKSFCMSEEEKNHTADIWVRRVQVSVHGER